MTGLSSRRVSIPRTFFCISLVVLCLVLLAAPEPGHANEDQYKAQRWGVPAQASGASELQVGDLYAVVVGVSKYKDTRIPALSVSDKDARSIAEFLKTQKNLFKDIHVSLFVNEDATSKALKKELYYKLKPAGKNDTVIVFLSGHGTDDPKNPGEFFFLPYDADSEFVAEAGIHMNRQWFVDKLDSKRVLIIADACYAGGFAGSGTKRLPPSLDKFMGQFKESEGRVFITSSRADELSKESPEFGHSLFTHFLLEGLSGKAADQDGVVRLEALYEYVYDKTKKASAGYQHPQMEPKRVGKFPVALARLHESTEPRNDNSYRSFSSVTSAVPSEIRKKEQFLVNKIAVIKEELSKTDEKTQTTARAILTKDMKAVQNELNVFVENIRKLYPAYSALEYSHTPTLEESGLRPEECVVMFNVSPQVSAQGVTVTLIRNKKVAKTYYREWKISDLEKEVREFRKPLEKFAPRDFDPDLAGNLYKKLLLKVLVDVPKGTPLIIIPDGILSALPFEALVTGGKAIWRKADNVKYERFNDYPDGLTFLADEHPISYCQSLSSLAQTRATDDKKKHTEKILVIADPIFSYSDPRSGFRPTQPGKQNKIQLMAVIEESSGTFQQLQRLPETQVLADNLQKMYGTNCLALTGFNANKPDFLSKIAPKIDQYGSIVFATHGHGSRPFEEPFLALSMVPAGTDGFLKMSDILSLKMNADIVALIACETGLSRAFQYAGAKSVLEAWWCVDEQTAVTLTENFFKHRKEGKTKLKALQAAREDIRNAGYKHPFFWAAFVLIGEAS